MKKIVISLVCLCTFILHVHGQDIYYPNEPAQVPFQITNQASLTSFNGQQSSFVISFYRGNPVGDGTSLDEMLATALSDFPFLSYSNLTWNQYSGEGSFRLTFSALPDPIIQRIVILENPDETQFTFRQTEPTHFHLCQRDTTDMIPHPADGRELYLAQGIRGDTYSLYRGAVLVKTVGGGSGEVSFGTFSEPGFYTVTSAQCGPLPVSHTLKYARFFLPGNLEWEVDFDLTQTVPDQGGSVTLTMIPTGILTETSSYYSDLFCRLFSLGIPGQWPSRMVPIGFNLTESVMTMTFTFPENNTGTTRTFDTGFYLASDNETLKFVQAPFINPFGGNNYIGKRTYIKADGTDSFDDVTYYDGLGYPEQEISLAAVPNGKSLIHPIVNDIMHHDDSIAYLPYSALLTDARYISNAIGNQLVYWQNKDTRPYSETQYEPSPYGRPVSFRREGSAYSQNNISTQTAYRINDGTESVRRLRYVSPSGNSPASISNEGHYSAGTLFYTCSISEDNDTSYVFTDAFQKTILTRRVNAGTNYDTYFIRDFRDSIVCIIQPMGVNLMGNGFPLNGSFADSYCFTYEYDPWGNLIRHHVPGGGTKQTIFDARNRSVLTTDSELLDKGFWRYMEYDAMDRIVEEGLCKSNYSIPAMRSSLQEQTDFSSLIYGRIVLHSCTYYNTSNNNQSGFLPISGVVSASDLDTQHCMTMLRSERIYEAPELSSSISQPSFYREKKYFYDYRGLPLQILESDSDGSIGRYSYKYDFTGNVLVSREEHAPFDAPSAILTIRNTYSDRGILLSSTASSNGMEHQTAYSYDDLGRLVQKTSNGVISEQYAYNLQGWQTHAVSTILGDGDDYDFWERLDQYYEGTGNRRYDGKLAQSHAIAGSDTHQEELYSNYLYDHLGRLVHGETLDTDSLPVASEHFSYDRNGNIVSLARIIGTNCEAISDTCSYVGNQLSVLVEDETDYTYEYDANGAMTYDGKNQVTLTRNILGLPYQLEDARGSYVEFSYLADGTKRYMVLDNSEGPQYYGSFIYRYDEAAGETYLESIAHPEGRFAATSYTSQHEPVYSNLHYVTDRVGSVVAVVDLDSVANDGTDAVLEGNGYTPFGERFAIGDFPKMHLNRFRFNGKEHLNRFGLPYIDYGARYYDPTIARWQRPDPMADKYPDISPYAFCANDPVNFVDLNGLDTVYVLRVSDNPVGHIAILVPDEGQYVLYSKNGRKFSTHDDDQGLSVGETAQSFLDNTTKNTVTHGQQADDNTFPYYDAAYAIEVSPEQVESIAQTMKEQTENSEDYNLFSNNCTTSVSLALEKAGVKTMPEGPINHIDSHHEGLMFTPVVFYHQLKLANPRIKELTPTKK